MACQRRVPGQRPGLGLDRVGRGPGGQWLRGTPRRRRRRRRRRRILASDQGSVGQAAAAGLMTPSVATSSVGGTLATGTEKWTLTSPVDDRLRRLSGRRHPSRHPRPAWSGHPDRAWKAILTVPGRRHPDQAACPRPAVALAHKSTSAAPVGWCPPAGFGGLEGGPASCG